VVTTTKRHRRIERRASAEVLEAYRAGRITARRADILLYLPADQQASELERRLSEAHERETRHRLVADAIRKYLDGLAGRKVDLVELGKIIREALPV
jgi:hypothetical protein